MKTLMFIVLFLLIGAFFIISENNIKINSSDNISEFSILYKDWLSNLLTNTKTVSGYLIKMEWLPEQIETVG